MVAASFDWNDLGSWNQLHDGSPLDAHGNARFGDVLTIDVNNSYLRSEDRLLAVAGLDNIIVVSQPDALLIVHRDKSHLVKDIAGQVKKTGEWPPLAVAHSGRPVPSPRVIRKWLFETALPLWAGAGVDREHGGVFEALNHDGSPADLGYKRLRVLARQIYCFANAELLGWEDRVGTLEPGKLADVIAVAGDPLEDLSELSRVIFVMIGGKVVKMPEGVTVAAPAMGSR